MKNFNKSRRASFQKLTLGIAGLLGISQVKASKANGVLKTSKNVQMYQDIPLFSGSVRHGNTIYVAGKGAHFEGDIKAHTDHVLKEIQKELENNGSSMEQVLKVNVYLADLADYHAMNEVYRGRFGSNPPVRTTVATYGGVPGNSLVEIDCIAAVD